jgi:hypothetical protein
LRGSAQEVIKLESSPAVTDILHSGKNVGSSFPTKVRSGFLWNTAYPARMIFLTAH